MKTKHFIHVSLLFLFVIFNYQTSIAQHHIDDWTALKALYESTNGDDWINSKGQDEMIACENESGFMQTANSYVCHEEVVNVKEAFSNIDENSMRAYVLHEGEEFDGVNYIKMNESGRFTSPGSNYTNLRLYVSTVIGPPNEDNLPNFEDECTVWTPYGAEYTFLDPISIDLVDERCDNGKYYVDVKLNGGVGNITSGLAYKSVYDGTNLYLNVSRDEIITFGPYQGAGNFEIVARGANGCSVTLNKNYACEGLMRTVSNSINADIVKIVYNEKDAKIKNVEVYNLQSQIMPAKISIDNFQCEVKPQTTTKGLYLIKILFANNETDFVKILR